MPRSGSPSSSSSLRTTSARFKCLCRARHWLNWRFRETLTRYVLMLVSESPIMKSFTINLEPEEEGLARQIAFDALSLQDHQH